MVSTQDSIQQLNSFLRGEISAVETYNQAIQHLKTSENAALLEQWRSSHEMRVALLRDQIQRLGGEPASGSGAWGAFVKLVEGGTSAFGERAAISVLEEGEDHGLKDYRDDVQKLDDASRSFVLNKILPEQQKTHAGLSALKRQMS